MIQRYSMSGKCDPDPKEVGRYLITLGEHEDPTGDFVRFEDLPRWRPIGEAEKDDKTKILIVQGFEPSVGMWLESHQKWIDFDPERFDGAELDREVRGMDFQPTHFITLEDFMRVFPVEGS